ncbi:TetR/AcrR family transcriptional regulator [Elizabethkingia anophelis]|uniref:TetR/AcrR family transcriptional regulator n=1 Tax=Elizabethkingia anophelis TaxID=1117645 RepID=UPI00099AA840|nr:TetR/AcrR family transcriptional regulator [Elizabethkingia anophelis]AVF50109.1 TetR/AcrR family transcriptional regulator [Elizabethkingia anophelis]AVF53513.1 TetR/AcrR family transcriptional regulator [Elizabethkingia anophelis]ELB0067888.1 TetR/AcrR family transcriptional regulator [Elizabethkingia anophelis]ELB0070503.1 TetR/AcrR family transcriptional regulator [Elizabethkingia anophelis]ELB1892583.1 TetR/AcrR family transcriptional regulator [Elizabethkingia anophelis]
MLNPPRERLLEAATILFHRQGYNNTGVNQIITESKVSKASFYDHFKSKDELCIAFLEKRYEYWASQWELFISKATTLKEKILQSFDFLVYISEKENFRGCSFLNISSEIPDDKIHIHETIRVHKHQIRSFFTSEIKDEILADHIYLLFEGAIMMGRIYRNNELTLRSKTIVNKLLKD